ncbi:DUF1501 domain-containing protein [Schlesneria sp. T3-172]|uniref:DUF1501 domain-containing protein n=1 Tax=Schlesneria sphaerica TaxID=3373610 RepID=UPI0037C5FD1F
MEKPFISRRDLLSSTACGFGSLALANLFARDQLFADEPQSELNGGLHHRAKVRRVIQLFMNGGASQMDLFDYKPLLFQKGGEDFDPGEGIRVEAATSAPGKILRPPFELRQHGETGRWVSDQLPHLARKVDQLAFCMAMQSRTNVHGPGSYLMNTGFLLPGFPSMGAWISYGLGSLTDNLPTFVVLPDARGLPYNQKGNFSAGFLSSTHQATILNTSLPAPIPDLRPPESAHFITEEADREGRELLRKLNHQHLAVNPGDSRLDARICAYELAARMQLSAPEALDIRSETEATQKAYGLDEKRTEDFGRRCLLARRLIERGVRFVQVWSGAGGAANNWDNHTSIVNELPPMCGSTDRPIAALLEDLEQRGLLEDTLVLWNTEFGRMPFSQGSEGRDHNGGTFVGWLAGAGVKAGATYGESDPWSWRAERDVTTTYDFHATVLHLLGIDHERLSVRHNGANRRLTDVHGHVIHDVLA